MTKRKTGEILDSNSERKMEKKIQLKYNYNQQRKIKSKEEETVFHFPCYKLECSILTRMLFCPSVNRFPELLYPNNFFLTGTLLEKFKDTITSKASIFLFGSDFDIVWNSDDH